MGISCKTFFITGSHDHSSKLLIQQKNGTFLQSQSQPWLAHAAQEQLDAVFFDADADGDQDLIVSSGSNEQDVREAIFTQRFYRNTGEGNYTYDDGALPSMQTSAQRIAVADVDADGDQDLFIAGRQTPGHYPFPPRSYLLMNDGHGKFVDITQQAGGKDLMGPGMITGCAFADMDGDGDLDLVTLANGWR